MDLVHNTLEGFTLEVSEASSLNDSFDSEGAYCEDYATRDLPKDVQIIGMELLLSNGGDFSDSLDDDSTFEYVASYSIPLKGSDADAYNVGRSNCRRTRKRRPADAYLSDWETDSLVLTRQRMPRLLKDVSMKRLEIAKHYREGRGLMGEKDSLSLDKKRLPHLARDHESTQASSLRSHTMYSSFVKALSRSLPTAEDEISLSSTDSASSASSSSIGVTTVDSLLLAKRRQMTTRILDKAIQLQSSSIATTGSSDAEIPKGCEKRSIAFDVQTLKRAQSGARAA